MSSTCFKP